MEKKTDKFKRMLFIYMSGYYTTGDWSVQDWFDARKFVLKNKQFIPRR